MLSFCIFAFLLGTLQSGVEASPAIHVKKAGTPPQACTETWGWPGFVRGTNPWGAVLNPTQSSQLSSELSSACASYTPTTTSSGAVSSGTTSSIVVVISSTTSVFPTTSTSTSKLTTSSSTALTSSPATSTRITTSSSATASPSASTSSVATTTTISTSSSPSATSTRISSSSTPIASSSSSSSIAPSSSSSSTASGATLTSTGSSVSQSDINTYLSTHNNVRAQHGASPLTWNNTLSAAAQSWANNCVFQHSGGKLGPYGENLAAGTGAYSITSAVTSWTNEVSSYNASNPQPSHFTQVVWKATTQLGCAVATCNGIFPASYGPAQYYVCEYFSQGNVIGRFPQNVQA